MKDHKHAALMMKLAERDCKALKGMLNDRVNFEDEVFGFHAQQAVEKLMKSYLSYNSIYYSKTHDIEILKNLLDENNIPLPYDFNNFIDLTDFAVNFRYDLDFHEELNREELFKNIMNLKEFIKDQINLK